MKAAQINDYGDASAIVINDAPVPQIKEGYVLVDVQTASINPFDIKLRSGFMKDGLPLIFPFTLGGDFAGTVLEVGKGVTHIKAGDKVYGQSYGFGGTSGAFAEITLAKGSHVALATANVDDTERAALPLVGISALQALTEHIQLKPDQRIFINGGGGGIGSIAIQIAKHIGAYVATTAAGDDLAYVKQLGADEIIDYTRLDFVEVLHDFDAVFDTVGGDDFNRSLEILKKGAIAVSMAGAANEAKAETLGVKALTQMTDLSTVRLNTLRELVEAGVVSSRVGKVFPLSQTREAFEAREKNGVKGKVVIKIVD